MSEEDLKSKAYHILLEDEQATVELGMRFAGLVQTGIVVHMEGVLGAGKTTFCRGVMKFFGHSGAVKSPTYTLVEPYEFGEMNLFHFDLYRLADPEELEYVGVRDYFDEGNICLIEWPSKGEGYLPDADLKVTLVPEGKMRRASFSGLTQKGLQIINSL